MTRKALRRFSIAAVVIGAIVFVDGLVLLFTNGLKTDASPILPEFGGSFAKSRSSGASLVVLGVAIVVLTLIGRWWLSRRMTAEEPSEAVMSEVALGGPSSPGATPRPAVDVETHEPAAPA